VKEEDGLATWGAIFGVAESSAVGECDSCHLNLPPIASSLAALIPGPSPKIGRRESALTPDPSPHSGRGGLAGFKDFLEHQADVGLDLFVPKPNNPITELFELARPLFILFSLQIMDVAINLKHQFFSAQ